LFLVAIFGGQYKIILPPLSLSPRFVSLNSELRDRGRFLRILLPDLEHIAFLVDGFPILIGNGDSRRDGFIADGANLRLRIKL
jgi:hypothetical protein